MIDLGVGAYDPQTLAWMIGIGIFVFIALILLVIVAIEIVTRIYKARWRREQRVRIYWDTATGKATTEQPPSKLNECPHDGVHWYDAFNRECYTEPPWERGTEEQRIWPNSAPPFPQPRIEAFDLREGTIHEQHDRALAESKLSEQEHINLGCAICQYRRRNAAASGSDPQQDREV